MTFDRSLTWLTLFSLLPLTLHPFLAWADRLPPEPASYRLPEKPIELISQENAPKENPLDGNDWVDNQDGTFTLKRSYLDEAAFKRTLNPMPYNDLDLYTMGLLDPNQVQAPFVIENPTLQDGRRLRMHSSGNLVEIQNPDGTWSGPYYLGSDTVVQGTKRNITLQDIVNLEGQRNPSPSASQKDFNVAFINLTNDEEASLDTLEHTQKLQRFRDSFTRFFQDMARNLGNLLFPRGESVGGSAIAVSSSSDSGIASPAPSLRGPATILGGDEAISELGVPLYSNPHGDSGIEPFEPLDLKTLRPVGFEESLERFLPSSYSLDTLKSSLTPGKMGTVPFSGTVPIFGDPSFFAEVLAPALKAVPALSTFQLSTLPVNLLTDAFEADFLEDIERPVLLSELKEQNLQSLRESFPEPLSSSSPLLSNPEALGGNSLPSLNSTPSPSPKRKPLSVSPDKEKDSKPAFHPPLVWDALKYRYGKEERSKKEGKKLKRLSSSIQKIKREIFGK